MPGEGAMTRIGGCDPRRAWAPESKTLPAKREGPYACIHLAAPPLTDSEYSNGNGILLIAISRIISLTFNTLSPKLPL